MKDDKQKQVEEYIRNIAQEEILKEKLREAEFQIDFYKMQKANNDMVMRALRGYNQ